MTKQHQTYGKVPGVSVTTTTGGSVTDPVDDAVGTVMPGVQLWGHNIILNGDDGITCSVCDMEEDVPNIFQESSGFREVVYKMYVLGKFKRADCEQEFETDQSVLNDDTTNVSFDPNKVHWTTDGAQTKGGDITQAADSYIPQGQTFNMGGMRYEYRGDGVFTETTTGRQHHALDLCRKHRGDAFRSLPSAISEQCKQHFAEQSAVDKTVDGGIQIGDVQGGAPDMQGVDVATDQSIATRAAKALKEKRNYLTR